jgi:hypothetical protein
MDRAVSGSRAWAVRWARRAGWRGRRRLTARRALALAALLLVVLVAGTVGFRSLQASYYEGLYIRNHTVPGGSQQLYSNFMPGLDHTLLVSADGGRTYTRASFVANEPVLTGGVSGSALLGLVPYTYRDAEVDLWMFQSGAGRSGETGLVVRADPATGNMVRFGVNQPAGTWSLREHAHGSWHDLQAPTSSDVINRHPGWDNLLTVIMRGDEYALLINYRFVGIYHSAALSSGNVGIFTSDGTMTCGCVQISVFRNVSS